MLKRRILELYEKLDDSALVLGGQLYQKALIFYNSLQQAASGTQPGTTEMLRDMRVRFLKSSSNEETGSGEVIDLSPDNAPDTPEAGPDEGPDLAA